MKLQNRSKQQTATTSVQFDIAQTAELITALLEGEKGVVDELSMNQIVFPASSLSNITTLLRAVGLRFATRKSGQSDTWVISATEGHLSGTVVPLDYVTRRESNKLGAEKFATIDWSKIPTASK